MKITYFAAPELKALAQHSAAIGSGPGWFSEIDWQCFLRGGVVYGHRLQSGEIVSSAYFSNFENRVGWLGAVIVNSRFQGKKLGRDLIQKALAISPDHDFTLAVIATERGKKMFEQAGFIEVGNSHKFVLNADRYSERANESDDETDGLRKFDFKDFDLVCELDRQAVGYSRHKLLRERIENSVSAVVLTNTSGDLIGFGVSNASGIQLSIGPLVAPSAIDAVKLLRSLTARGGEVKIEIPHWQSEYINAVASLGFELERICPLLTYAGRSLPAASDMYFGFMSQALG